MMTSREQVEGASASDDRPVVLACEHLWKIYGPDPERFVDRGGAGRRVRGSHGEIAATGHIPAVADMSFDVRSREIFVIMGLSGSGKSTAIRCLSRLVEPTSGRVTFNGRDLLAATPRELIEIRRHQFGMVFQHFGLIPNLSVMENVAFPLKLQRVALHERENRAAGMIELVGLKGRENTYPHELSGGQQQRVGIARSLCVNPDLWFLDEPFSALDPLIRRQMQDEFLGIQRRLNKTIVFITHDFMEAVRIADRMAIMRDGSIVQVGTPAEILLSPVDEYVAEFSGDVPRSRVLTAGDVMRPDRAADPGDAVKVVESAPLEEVLALFTAGRSSIRVVDGAGACSGSVTLEHALAAAHGQRHEPRPAAC